MKRVRFITASFFVLILSSAAITIVLGTASASPTSQHRIRRQASTAFTPMTETAIQSLALAGAASNGDPNPSLIQHVVGSKAELSGFLARHVQPTSSTDSDPSLLIAEKGNFVANVPVLQGPDPTGTVVMFLVDQTSGQVTGFGIEHEYPDLAALGAVTTDSNSAIHSQELRMHLRHHLRHRP